MRKRFTCDIELSEEDMHAFLEIVAQNAIAFSMQDIDERTHTRANGHGFHVKHKRIDFPKHSTIHITSKAHSHLLGQSRDVLEALRSKYGMLPFRKGDASREMQKQFGKGASSVMTNLCRHGYLAIE